MRDNRSKDRHGSSGESLSPLQRAAAELLLGRPLDDKESVSVQAFETASVSEQRRLEVSAGTTKVVQ
jgi:hypothetical protein